MSSNNPITPYNEKLALNP